MGLPNPFVIVIVTTGIIMMVVMGFSIIAPSLTTEYTDQYGKVHRTIYGQEVPIQPDPPKYTNINNQGNLTRLAMGGWAFDENHTVYVGNSVTYSTFNPIKYVTEIHYEATRHESMHDIPSVQATIDGFNDAYIVSRDPWPGYTQPIWFADDSKARSTWSYAGIITPQDVIDNANTTTTSFFIIDKDNADGYSAYMEFTPVSGASTLQDSWNSHHGFTVRIMGNDYATPSWMEQAGAFLSWIAEIIGFVVQYIGYITAISAVLITVITGINPTIASAIIVLIAGAFIGSVFAFLRGSGGDSK